MKSIAARIHNWLLRLSPFYKKRRALLKRINQQEEQIRTLTSLLGMDKRRTAQLGLLSDVAQEMKTVLDQPVSAQLAVNAIRRAYDCPLVTILQYDAEHNEFVAMASAGRSNGLLPPSYRQNGGQGVAGRAKRLRSTQLVNDTRRDTDYISAEGHVFLSELAVPLVQHGRINGVLIVDQDNPGAFSDTDIATIETVAELLLDSWDRSEYQRRLTEFIRAGIALSTTLETQAAIDQIAAIARKTLDARFVFVTLLDQDGSFTRVAHAGHAPALFRALKENAEQDPLIQQTLNSEGIIRLRDFHKGDISSHLKADQASLKSLLAFPIRLHQLSVGVVLVFGKHSQSIFSENDESLASLIASQAAAAVESTWLYQELRSTLNTTTILYQLSIRIIQAEDLSKAAEAIAETAFKLGHASVTGIVLYTPSHEIEARVEVDANGIEAGGSHPFQLIEQAIETGQTIIISDDRYASKVCIPLQTSRRTYGAIWFDIPEGRWYNSRYAANLQTLTNQATIALERSILLSETRSQTKRLEAAYQELEDTYDQTLTALMSALDARDRETEGHSARVSRIACRLGEELGLAPHHLKALERGALLHDIGKIGVSDSILHKPGPLNTDEWEAMRKHPEIGARIIARVPFLSDTISIIHSHQERWDGSGYPAGLTQDDIPLLARIFAVADAFDALTSDRPYRKGVAEGEAMDYIRSQTGILFDPQITMIFEAMVRDGKIDDLL